MGEGEDRGSLRRLFEGISRAKDLGLVARGRLRRSSPRPGATSMPTRRTSGACARPGNVDFGDLILLPLRLLRREPDLKRRAHAAVPGGARRRVPGLERRAVPPAARAARDRTATSAWSATTTSPSTGSGAPRSATSSPSRTRSRAPRSSASSATTAPRRPSSTWPRRSWAATRAGWARPSGPSSSGGEPVTLARLGDQDDEAAWCARLVRQGDAMETAILYRTNAQSRPFEELFFRLGIPYRVVGTVRFYAREEVKDAIAWLALLANGRDEIAFRRVANRPARGTRQGEPGADRRGLARGRRYAVGRLPARADRGSARRPGPAPRTSSRRATSSPACSDASPLGALLEAILARTGLAALYAERDQADGTVQGRQPRGAGERHRGLPRGRRGAHAVPRALRPERGARGGRRGSRRGRTG